MNTVVYTWALGDVEVVEVRDEAWGVYDAIVAYTPF